MYSVDKIVVDRDGSRGTVIPDVAIFKDRRAAEFWAAMLNLTANMMSGMQEHEYVVTVKEVCE